MHRPAPPNWLAPSIGDGGSRSRSLSQSRRWEEHDPRLQSGKRLRLRIDIRHLCLGGLGELKGAAVAAVGKHVCGVATDLMLRCVGAELGCRSIGVALCCHHLCTWDDYVNPAYVTAAGFSRSDFRRICRLSCWATTEHGPTTDPYRRRVGLACKAFVDVGRCLYLRERGFDASLVRYCSADETPENRLLLAKRK